MAETCFEKNEFQESDSDLQPWQEVSRNDSSPFVHKFQTPRQKYVYDVNTRRIIRVSPVVWDILEDYGCMDSQQIIRKHSASHNADQVIAAMKQITSVREEKGLFLSVRPKEISLPAEENIRKRLDEEREQLILNVTEDCNFRCSYCVFSGQYRHFRTHSSKAMDWNIARPAIDEFLAHSKHSESRTISFYGGEPLLNLPLIRQCVSHVKEKYEGLQAQFSLTTNGFLLRGEVARFLAAERFLLLLSLDGPSEIHDRHRRTQRGNPTWAQVVSNIREFLATYPEYQTNNLIRFNAVATRTTNLCEADHFWGSCELFSDCMGLEVSQQKQAAEKSNVLLPNDPLAVSSKALYGEFIQGLKRGRFGKERSHKSKWMQTAAFERPFITFHKRGYLSPHLPEKMVFLNHCVLGARKTFVDTDGSYFACERVVSCQEQAIGDIGEGVNLEKVMNLLGRWAQANKSQCRYCWCLPICRMGCLATVSDGGIVTEEAKKRTCAIHRRDMHHLLAEYSGILEENREAFDYAEAMEFH